MVKCQGVIGLWDKVPSNKFYGIGHVLTKTEFNETPRSSIEQSFKAATQSILMQLSSSME